MLGLVNLSSCHVIKNCFSVLGLADSNLQGFKDELRQYWFMRYSRSRGAELDSGGFEHVFVGEVRGNSVTGFHNWVQFYESEREGVLDYTAFRNQCQVYRCTGIQVPGVLIIKEG